MSILVIGSTGTVGSLVVQGLAKQGAQVKAMVRRTGTQSLPAGVDGVVADLGDVNSLRLAMSGVRTLFLLNALAPDEVTQSLQALSVAREAGIQRIVYLSVIHADLYTDVPHFTGKHTVERMIESLDLPATILRPAYFMQNDAAIQSVIEGYGVFPMPIGAKGCAMVDVRDIADIAVAELLRRDRSPEPLPRLTLEVAGNEVFTGEAAAAVWGQALNREIRYGGDDVQAFEAQLAAQHVPAWMAYDLRLMMSRIQQLGQIPAAGATRTLEKMLGRPLRTYQAFVAERVAT
ncbi:NmrA family NAD(P)-binding protein [Pelomonas sp. Root1237]|uniref:NmrA family NAD(P)-binding protein n=1 Tax=Pelomonas sp. Root1237 TaxID=1736434 RepID=UPI0007014344|nr:NmrA family NAD(P)-binding protein [Pelomonas sp. Root1237]KQV86395.1 NmrA family transcriptional regulator [Pelomonas sp. Root1237]